MARTPTPRAAKSLRISKPLLPVKKKKKKKKMRPPTRVRYERLTDILEAFHHLAAALICLSFTERGPC